MRQILWPAGLTRFGPGQAGAPLLGLFGLVLLWAAVLHTLAAERDQSLQGAVQNTTNLSRVFEEHIVRSLKSVDQSLLYIRDLYESYPAGFDLTEWTRRTQAMTDLSFQITLIGKDGLVITSNLLSGTARVDLSDREHFRVHRDRPEDRLFVSKPVLGRVSHKWSIQVTRKLIANDGSFDGVIVISLDPEYLAGFYGSIDLGERGVVTLVGLDGIIRARSTTQQSGTDKESAIGKSVLGGRLLTEYSHAHSGTFVVTSAMDGVRRITSYRGVRGYPLVVSVGVEQAATLAVYQTNRSTYLAVAAILSFVLVLATALVVIRQFRLSQARERLRQSEAAYAKKSDLLELTLQHMSQGLMMVDAGGRVQVCNDRAVQHLGLPASLMDTQPLFEDVRRLQWENGEFGADGQSLPADVRSFVLSGGTSDKSNLYERVRPNGVILEVRSIPVPGGGFVRTFTDITRNKETEASLRTAMERADKAAQAKSEFLATMSHEIRSPVSALVGVVELLCEMPLGQDQAGMVDMIGGSANTLLAVLNDILDFSKIEAGALSIMHEPVSLRELVSQLAEPYAIEAGRKGVALHVQFAHDLPTHVQTDPLRLRQILNNLLSNAIKFTALGSVSLSVHTTGTGQPWLHFGVQDTGIGIEPSVIARLFAAFVQADSSTTRNYGGTGLGLCICQRLAELLDGTIEVESLAGTGSTFTLNLPLLHARMPEESMVAALPAIPHPIRIGRVLVADDDPSNRWLIQRQLQLLGLEVDTADNGRSALERLRSGHYQLLITDCHMPEMNGSALARAVRASPDPALSAIPIIGLTADTTAAQRARCFDAGMSDVAIKPVSRGTMSRLLRPFAIAVDGTPAAPQPASPKHPIFDRNTYHDLFEPCDPEGVGWLTEYLGGACDMMAELQSNLAASEIDRPDVAATAHRLAGSSLSVGATSLGHAARQLERAADDVDHPVLAEVQEALIRHYDDARTAIEGFIAEQPVRSNSSARSDHATSPAGG